MKRTRDIELTSSIVAFYSIIGVLPPISKKRSILALILTTFSLGSLLVVTKLLIFDEFSKFRFAPTSVILNIGSILTLIVFNLLCLKNIWIPSASWNDLFQLFEEFDFKSEGNRIHLDENALLYYLKIVLFNIGNIILFILMFLSIARDFSYMSLVWYSYGFLIGIQMFASTLIFWDLIRMICKRYNFLEKKITEIYQSPKSNIFWNKYQFKKLINILNTMVQQITHFFGQRILIMLILTFFNVLNIFEFIFIIIPLMKIHNFSLLRKLAVLLETSWLLVSINKYITL